MVIATFPIYHLIEAKIKRYKKLKTLAPVLSAGIVTLVVSLIVFIPITVFSFHFLSHPADSMAMIQSLMDKVDTLSQHLPYYLEWLRSPLDTIIPMTETRKEAITALLARWLGMGLKNFMIMLGNMAMIVVFFFFFTLYSRRLIFFFVPIVPLECSLKREFFAEMTMMVSVVFYNLSRCNDCARISVWSFYCFF